MQLFLYNSESNKAVNLANIEDIFISDNYLILTTNGGLNAREIRFVYGTPAKLSKLFKAIMEFIKDYQQGAFDCYDFIKNL